MQTHPHTQAVTSEVSIEKLQDCLRSEISAVETYELALHGVTHVGLHRALQEILLSHARRTERLRERIERLGGKAPKGSGVWGAFAKAIQAGADLLGDRAAIAALEEGERHGLDLYTAAAARCDVRTRTFIDEEMLPEQQHTHDLCRSLKDYVSLPS